MAIKKRNVSAPDVFAYCKQVALFVDGKKILTLTYSNFLKEYRRLKDLQGITFKSIKGETMS